MTCDTRPRSGRAVSISPWPSKISNYRKLERKWQLAPILLLNLQPPPLRLLRRSPQDRP